PGVLHEPGQHFGQSGFTGTVFTEDRGGRCLQCCRDAFEEDSFRFDGDRHVFEFDHSFLTNTATPMPPAIAAAVMPSVPGGAPASWSRVVKNAMAPEAAHGWPCASAPPWRFTDAGSRPKC